jgi:hypothetical protein
MSLCAGAAGGFLPLHVTGRIRASYGNAVHGKPQGWVLSGLPEIQKYIKDRAKLVLMQAVGQDKLSKTNTPYIYAMWQPYRLGTNQPTTMQRTHHTRPRT